MTWTRARGTGRPDESTTIPATCPASANAATETNTIIPAAQTRAAHEPYKRECPPALFELRRGLAVALAKAETCKGVSGDEVPRKEDEVPRKEKETDTRASFRRAYAPMAVNGPGRPGILARGSSRAPCAFPFPYPTLRVATAEPWPPAQPGRPGAVPPPFPLRPPPGL